MNIPRLSASTFTHSGFFVLRTPLLPLEVMQTWGSSNPKPNGARTTSANGSGPEIPSDEDGLRTRLRAFFDTPDIRDALFIASPAVEEAIRRDGATKDIDKRDRLDASLTKYFMRMAGRCTPFGAFAGISVGTFAPTTELKLAERARYRRVTRIDMGYLAMLVDGLMRDPRVRHAVRYKPNSTLYVTGGRARYVEHRPGKRSRSYFLVSADLDEPLKEVLALASAGETYDGLASALARDGIEIEEAHAYVDELIQGQVLEPDLAPAVTGADPMADLEHQIASHPGLEPLVETLASVRQRLAQIDDAGVGAAPQAYRDIAAALKSLPADPNIDRLFQVDMAKPVEILTLSESLLDEVYRVAAALERIFGGSPNDPLENFKKTFAERYGEREIPLLEALDEECGVGLGNRSIQSEASPLLAGLRFPSMPGEQRVPWGPLQVFLLRRLTEVRSDPLEPIRLQDEDIARFPAPSQPRPNAMSVMLSLKAASGEGGTPWFVWKGTMGPSGARALGRFCHTDPDLLREVREHLRSEEALDPERLYCEIVHLPEGRMGNVIARPLLRDYEIVFLARAGAVEDRQIPLSDLVVSVRAGRIVLRSKLLGREIVPRMTNAHNITMGIGVYRFLGMLQTQGVQAGLSWYWGPFDSLPFLPRVEYGSAILSPARWIVQRSAFETQEPKDVKQPKGSVLGRTAGADPSLKFQEWATEHRLPRWLGLREADNVLPVDRENLFSVRALLDAVDRRSSFELLELPWMGEPGAVSGPEGTFANEIIIPLVRTPTTGDVKENVGRGNARPHSSDSSIFIPGSQWLYGRWDTAPGYADAVLVDALAPVVRQLRSDGVVDSWFFIRYADPDFHLRFRLRGGPAPLTAIAMPRLRTIGEDMLQRGLITKVVYDTYDREVSRYGGPHGIELCEAVFGIDSDAALELISSTLGDEGATARWKLTLCGMDYFLRDAGFDLEQRYFFAQRKAESYSREFHLQGDARHPIQDRFRVERKDLLPLLTEGKSPDLAPGLAIFERRSGELQPLLGELRQRDIAGALMSPFEDILASFIHMHANRMLPTAARPQEAVLYRFLENLYDSQLARSGRKKRDRKMAEVP